MRWPWRSHSRRDLDLDEEIQAHLAMAQRDRIERGETPQAAERAARREFGNRTAIREITREVWRWNFLERLWQDVRYALRQMRRSPGFTAVAVLSLALGIGANTAIFSLINTLMLQLLPVQEPEQLVELLHQFPGDPRLNGYSLEAYRHLRDHNQVLSGLIAASPPVASRVSARGDGAEPETLEGQYVDGGFFPVLGVTPAMGRLLGPDDDSATAAPAAVVSWSYWQNRFNLDPAIVGQKIIFEDLPVTIVGVAPRGFFGLMLGSNPQVWLPIAADAMIHGAGERHMGVGLIGRLKPGVAIAQAQAELATLYLQTFSQTELESYHVRNLTFELEPARASPSIVRDQYAKPLLFVMAVVGLLLLIACTNVASMLLARGASREREMALRVALGAGKLRLLRQVLTESLLLSTAGTLAGVFFAYFGAGMLVRIIASGRSIPGLPHALEIPVEPDVRVLLFTAAVALLTGVLFGLVPALRAMSAAPASSLRAAGKGGETRLGRLFGNSLVVSQVALSVLLLSAAGLFLQHLSSLRKGLGFQRDNLLLVTLDPARGGYDPDQLARAYRELLERLETIPGVRSATLSGMTPISGAGASRYVNVEGRQDAVGERRYHSLNWVAPRYFETLGTPLLSGRDFTLQDRANAHLAVINQTMSRYYFGDDSPIGRRFTIEGDAKPYEIIGVVGDAKYYDPQEATNNTIYLTAFQEGSMFARNFVLRTQVAPAAVTSEVRRALRDLLKNVRVERFTTMADQVDAAIVPERLLAMLSGVFGALGSLLAAIGLYGLLAYTVARRVNEIGIRMALGATSGDATRMILRDALRLVCAGLAIGVPLAFWSKRFAASVIEGLPLGNPVPIVVGGAAMIAVALLAAYVPARRAASVDPMEALRHE